MPSACGGALWRALLVDASTLSVSSAPLHTHLQQSMKSEECGVHSWSLNSAWAQIKPFPKSVKTLRHVIRDFLDESSCRTIPEESRLLAACRSPHGARQGTFGLGCNRGHHPQDPSMDVRCWTYVNWRSMWSNITWCRLVAR